MHQSQIHCIVLFAITSTVGQGCYPSAKLNIFLKDVVQQIPIFENIPKFPFVFCV
jgi:hypothetical protein